MKWRQKKIKAGSLQFAVLISVVISIIISAFILLSYTQQQFANQIEFSDQAIKLSTGGFDYLKQQEIPYNDSITYIVENTKNESFTLYKGHWGIYDKVISRGRSHNFNHQKIALIGGKTLSKDRTSIHLDDTNSPLVVVGETKIIGNVILPERGIKTGSISGVSFRGDQLVYGAINNTIKVRPSISSDKNRYLQSLLYGSIPDQDSLYIRSDSEVISSSFNTDPKWLYRREVIQIDNQVLENNLIIKSDTLIRVSAFAKANNVIFIAPYIKIDHNVVGNFQAIASKSIEVGENVTLNYPSALILLTKDEKETESREGIHGISLGSRSILSGSILQQGTSSNRYQRAIIKLAEDSVVRGEVHSDQSIELLGTVVGSVYTNQFEVGVKGSVYKNHLYNTIINSRDFPESFCGIQSDITQVNVGQWVY